MMMMMMMIQETKMELLRSILQKTRPVRLRDEVSHTVKTNRLCEELETDRL